MQFYLAALDDLARQEGENPSIGIILCKTKDRTIVEYALRESNNPSVQRNTASSQASLPILRTSSSPRNKLQNCWKTFHEHLERNGFLQGNIS